MDIRTIEMVLGIARCGSISAAAAELGFAQSTLSKALLRLETRLGVKLFQRRRRGVEPTVYGNVLLAHGNIIHRQVKDALDTLATLVGGEGGEITIGAGQTWLLGPVAEAIALVVRKRPNMRIVVLTDPVERMLEDLRAGRLDFVLSAWIEDFHAPELEWMPMIIDDLRIMARRGHPLIAAPPTALDELLAYGWVLPTGGNPTSRRLDTVFKSEGLPPPDPVIETPSVSLTVDIVRRSDLLTVLPDVRFEGANAGLAPIANPVMAWRRTSGIFKRREATLVPAATALIDALIAICRRYYPEIADRPSSPTKRPRRKMIATAEETRP
jgi:LysR family transcriptional regulator of gallate degradation